MKKVNKNYLIKEEEIGKLIKKWDKYKEDWGDCEGCAGVDDCINDLKKLFKLIQ